MDHKQAALEYAHTHQEQFLDELKEFIRIPSVSTDVLAKPDMQKAAHWVANKLTSLGIENVSIMPTSGHPVVYGEYLQAGKDKPIILVYGHYDVQPAEPLELWHSPAFEPTQVGENLFGRGASDMKGQIAASLQAIEAISKTGGLPINLKFLIEGEEEIGSPNLEPFIRENANLLSCDLVVNPDTGMIAADVPTITYGLRGLAYFELRVYGANSDLHSGLFGGAVHNPAQVLCELIAGMHDSKGHVTLPNFYNSVKPLADNERIELARLPMNDEWFQAQTGVPKLYGEEGYTSIERVGARPTLEVNGLLSGFTGVGSKTVLPSYAMAKISMRLVPDQDPGEVHQQLTHYLVQNAPESIRWELTKMAGGPASITNLDIPGVKAISQALEETWGTRPVYRREGGSVPVTAQFKDILGAESVLTGFGLPDDNLHAPNEKLHLPTYFRGIQALVRFFCILGE